MKTGNLDSKLDMDTLSPAAQQGMAQKKSEDRYLVDQAANARTAMTQTVSEIKQTLAQLTDVRACARQHPWIATGSAIVAGFVAGAVLSSPRSTSGASSQVKTDANATPDSKEHDPVRAQPGFLFSTLKPVLTGLVQTLVQSFIAAAVVSTEVDQVKEERPTPDGSTCGSSTPRHSTPLDTPECATP